MQFRARSSRPFSPIAFNWALQSWQDSGAVGLCALVFLLGASLWQACAHARRSGKGDFAPQVSILWAAGLVAVLIRDMSYSSITLDPGVMLVLWTGLAATAGAATAERNQQEVACSVPQELATVG
jgi:O-antigen ligase